MLQVRSEAAQPLDHGLARYGDDTFRFHENLVHDYWSADGEERAIRRVGYCAGLRYSASLFAAVLEELDRVIDPQDPRGGSILDNTIVFWHNEFGHDGHDNQHTRHPAIIAGGGGGVLKLGRYLRLRDIASSDRVPHNLLLTSIAQAMGRTKGGLNTKLAMIVDTLGRPVAMQLAPGNRHDLKACAGLWSEQSGGWLETRACWRH